MKVPVVRFIVEDGAKLPHYATHGASGADVYAYLPEGSVTLPPLGGRALIPTGLTIELPQGYEAQVRPRSGLAAKHGISVVNSPGTIDWDYRGELTIILINYSEQEFVVHHTDRIAQLVISPVVQAEFEEAQQLSETQRGERGFGSTGV